MTKHESTPATLDLDQLEQLAKAATPDPQLWLDAVAVAVHPEWSLRGMPSQYDPGEVLRRVQTLVARYREGAAAAPAALDLDDLERKAKLAQSGPWRAQGDSDGRPVVMAALRGVAYTWLVDDAEYIAAAHPGALLSLIAAARRLARLESALEFLDKREGTPNGGKAFAERTVQEILRRATSFGWRYPEGGSDGSEG